MPKTFTLWISRPIPWPIHQSPIKTYLEYNRNRQMQARKTVVSPNLVWFRLLHTRFFLLFIRCFGRWWRLCFLRRCFCGDWFWLSWRDLLRRHFRWCRPRNDSTASVIRFHAIFQLERIRRLQIVAFRNVFDRCCQMITHQRNQKHWKSFSYRMQRSLVPIVVWWLAVYLCKSLNQLFVLLLRFQTKVSVSRSSQTRDVETT
jgi:hypothetical protein